jgi:hypothetical protein
VGPVRMITEHSLQPERPKYRLLAYFALNAGFIVLALILQGIGGSDNPRLLHVILLFAVCSTSITDLDGLNGKYALLAMFLAFYFVSFGLGDFNNLVAGFSSEKTPSYFSETEAVILSGAVMFALAYRLAVYIASPTLQTPMQRDWSTSTALIVGLTLWLVGTIQLFWWNVYLFPDSSQEASQRGLASLSPIAIAANLLAGLLQPVGILLIAYIWRARRANFLLPFLVAIVILQIVLGFVVNIKSLAMIAGILIIVAYIFIDGRLPKGWLAAAAVFAVIGFPVFQASRFEIHGNRHIARTTILENLGQVLELAVAAENRAYKGPERAQTLLERTSVRGSIQMIVERTGNDVPFQHGHTLAPVLVTFIPRILWADKFGVSTGLLVNKEFKLSDSPDVYISPSIPGELYWNFGWPGVLLGMTAIAGAVGVIGCRFNLSRSKTVTGLLVVVLTIKQVIVAMEGSFSPEYVVWLRSLGAVGVLHLLFARVRVGAQTIAVDAQPQNAKVESSPGVKAFPNLLH